MSTRQATPGPSNGAVLQPQPFNSKKRAMSEGDVDGNNATNQKRVKKDESAAEGAFSHDGPNNKDKKKRKKKKRKLSVVLAATIGPDIARARSKSRPRSATATAQPQARASPSDTKPSANIATPEAVDGTPEIGIEDDASPTTPYTDKGKGKAQESREESQTPIASTSIESPEAHIACLTKELEAQGLLLQRHQAQLSHIHQSLTCQICLDLLHKPFALAPCGHVACHGCLVRWFTAPSGNNPVPRYVQEGNAAELSHISKRKTCPICRTVVAERPVEVWSIKSMVGGLIRSGLVELVVPPPAAGDDVPTQGPDGNPDPWRHIFRPASRSRNNFDFFDILPPINADENAPRGELAEMGMYDAEDGGIYRCIDCMNEIWEGACTGCHRVYAGHQAADDGDDALSDEGDEGRPRPGFGGMRGRRRMLRDFFSMLARGGPGAGALDLEEDDESDIGFGGGMFDDEDDDDDDNDDEDPGLSEAFAERYRQLGEAHAFGGLPGVPPPPPALPYIPPGFQVFAEFTDDEDEGHEDSDSEAGIARIDEEVDEEGYESSFVDDDDDNTDADIRRIATRSEGRRLIDPGSDSDPIIVSGGDGGDGDIPGEDVIRNIGRGVRLGASGSNRRGASRRGGNRVIVIDSDESGSSDIEVIGSPDENEGRGRGPRRRRISSSMCEEVEGGSDDDERGRYGEDDSIPGPASRLRRLMDEDEDRW